MEVVNLKDREEKKRINDLLEVLDDIRKQVEEGSVSEFVISSLDQYGEVQIHACVKDTVGGIGLFEIGKTILFQRQQMADYD